MTLTQPQSLAGVVAKAEAFQAIQRSGWQHCIAQWRDDLAASIAADVLRSEGRPMLDMENQRARLDLECAVDDLKGDVLLLGLAVDMVSTLDSEARQLGRWDDGNLLLSFTEDQLTTLLHARNNLERSMKEASRLLHGEPAA